MCNFDKLKTHLTFYKLNQNQIMKKWTAMIVLFALAFTGCSSEDSGNVNNGNGGTDGGGEVVKRKTYGSFTVNTKVNEKDVTYKYWNYSPLTYISPKLGKTYLIMQDMVAYESKEEKKAITKERIEKYGDLRGGNLIVSLSQPVEGLFTITRGFAYKPAGKSKLATLQVSLGIENEEGQKEGKNDAKYIYVDEGFYADALEVTKDKDGIFHFVLKKPIPLVFKEGNHGYGNAKAPRAITVTIDNGHGHSASSVGGSKE